MWPADSPPARGWQQRASEQAARVARCIVVTAFTCGASARWLSTDGQTSRRTNSGRKERVACGAAATAKGVKSPRLPYSGPLVASRPRFNRRNGPNQRGGMDRAFSLFLPPPSPLDMQGVTACRRASCACGVQCSACTSPPRAPPPCAADH